MTTTTTTLDMIPEILTAFGLDTNDRPVAYQIMKLVEGVLAIERAQHDVLRLTSQITDECANIERQAQQGQMLNTSWVASNTKSLCDAALTLDFTAKGVREACYALSLLVADDASAELRKVLIALVMPAA